MRAGRGVVGRPERRPRLALQEEQGDLGGRGEGHLRQLAGEAAHRQHVPPVDRALQLSGDRALRGHTNVCSHRPQVLVEGALAGPGKRPHCGALCGRWVCGHGPAAGGASPEGGRDGRKRTPIDATAARRLPGDHREDPRGAGGGTVPWRRPWRDFGMQRNSRALGPTAGSTSCSPS